MWVDLWLNLVVRRSGSAGDGDARQVIGAHDADTETSLSGGSDDAAVAAAAAPLTPSSATAPSEPTSMLTFRPSNAPVTDCSPLSFFCSQR